MKRLIPICLFAATLSATQWLVQADDVRTQDSKPQLAEQGFLGVVVVAAHPTLAANLKNTLTPEQGLTVEDIEPDSPAAKAGIRIHDVLTLYENQKLFSSDQFAKLVRSDRPGRQVVLEILREGKLQTLRPVVGKLDPADYRAWTPSSDAQPYRFGIPDRVPRRFQGHPKQAGEWTNFDSLTLKKLGDDKFQIEIQLLDQQGNTQKHKFEGSREQIRAAVVADKELQSAERAHLLRSLNLHLPSDGSPLPHIWFEPGRGWLFEQPGGPFH